MEFTKVPYGLLILSVRLFAFPAKATLIPLAGFGDETVVGLVRLETTLAKRVDLVNLLALKTAQEGFSGYRVLDGWDDPIDREGATSRRFF